MPKRNYGRWKYNVADLSEEFSETVKETLTDKYLIVYKCYLLRYDDIALKTISLSGRVEPFGRRSLPVNGIEADLRCGEARA